VCQDEPHFPAYSSCKDNVYARRRRTAR
jgi:hypothetical protein